MIQTPKITVIIDNIIKHKNDVSKKKSKLMQTSYIIISNTSEEIITWMQQWISIINNLLYMRTL